MLETVGAFILGFGILLSFINFFWSSKHGKIAGKNPWNADTLEWSTDSPPKAYGSVHLPTVITRHPLWDDYEEDKDPEGERVLDQDRLTLSTTWLDAEMFSLVRIDSDSILPLLLAIGLLVLFGAITFQLMWVAAGAIVYSLIVGAIWLWPKAEEGELV